jgi:hypothetical protein
MLARGAAMAINPETTDALAFGIPTAILSFADEVME